MSFLAELKKQKEKLRGAKTVVTRLDGKKYVDGDERVELENSPYGFVVDTKPDDVPIPISVHVYIGSQDCANYKVCTEYNIKHILSLGVDMNVSGVNQKFIYMLDIPETDIRPLLAECLSFVRAAADKHENVLVHCNAGVSRTSTVAIAYVMHYECMAYEDAYNFVKLKRPAIRPNDGFRDQLKVLKPGQLI